MRFYLATSFIFPRSFRLRLFAICFVGTHVPLLTYILWGVATGRLVLADVLLLLLATVIGMGLALSGIGALLAPLQAAIEQGKAPLPLPPGKDVAGAVLDGVNPAGDAADRRARALELAAHEDVLTGALNRRGFLAEIERAEARSHGVIALLDLDYFKQVNDRLGHDTGDLVLRGFAGRLSAELRRRDVLARWGGEEFSVLFWDVTEREAATVLERVARSLREDPLATVDGRPVTFSAGLARFRQGWLEASLNLADEALYEAKHAGRDRIVREAPVAAGEVGAD
ncbi:GGDEF domain-containing protein [Sphingomonas sp. CJ20]